MAAKAALKVRNKAVAKKRGSRSFVAEQPRDVRIAGSLSIALLLFALLGLLESVFWLGSVARELCQWFFLASLVIGAFALLRRVKWIAAVNVLVLVLCALPLWPLYRNTRPTPAGGPELRIASATFGAQSPSPAAVARLVARESLDVLALVNVPEADLRKFDRALTLKRIATAGTPASRRVLYTHVQQSKASAAAGRDDVRRIHVQRCDIELAVVDVPSLLDPTERRARAQALSDLPRASRTGLAVWLGHFGGRADAADLRRQEAQLVLRDSREGHGILATAPASLKAFGRPVDHALVQGWIAVRKRSVTEPLAAGAHRTVVAALELTDRRCR